MFSCKNLQRRTEQRHRGETKSGDEEFLFLTDTVEILIKNYYYVQILNEETSMSELTR